MATHYRHRQPGGLTSWGLGSVTVFAAALAILIARDDPGGALLPAAATALFLLLGVMFAGLTVEVSQDRVRFWFGPGWIRKAIPATEIESVLTVRNKWYYGWGIRLTPHGWLFNISGLDAVEIRLRSGRKYRIGTDDPGALRSAIERVIPPTTS